VAKGIDELAGRAAARAVERDGAAAASKIEIKARVKSALSPVERLSEEEMLKLVERACIAKDYLDLTDPNERRQAVEDYHRYGAHASEYAALLREFGELLNRPRISQGVVVTVGTICAAAGGN
jgi:hypothetical protein